MNDLHQPVLLNEVIEILAPKPGMRILDGTFGRGGHTREFLKRGASVIALDRDPEAILAAGEIKAQWGENFRIVKSDFRDLGEIAKSEGPMDGILLDLGISSPQIDCGERGFSFQQDGPLDMRMDTESVLTAEIIVNEKTEQELETIFKEYGEEKNSRRIAREIARVRVQSPIRTTGRLAQVVSDAVGGRRGSKTHPATRVFQAIRIAVNDELGALRQALESAPSSLVAGGRLGVITFHSLEDRIVKKDIARRSDPEIRVPGVPFGHPNPDYCYKKLGDWSPTEEEIASNSRARSARLRVAERI